MEETLGVDLENLCSFVSDDIYQFLSSGTESTSSNECSAPTVMNDDHYPLYPELEPHLLEAEIDKLLSECSDQYEFKSESPSSSGIVHQHHDQEAPSSPKCPFAPQKPSQKFPKLKIWLYHKKLLQTLSIVWGCGISGAAIELSHTETQ